VTQTAIESAMDDLKEQSLLESVGSESFDKSEQIHSGIITSSTSTYESVSLEQQSEELPTDAQTEETSEANTEDPVFEAELNTPAELKTPDDLKTPDFAKDNYNIAPVTRGDELLEPCEPCNENELKSEHAFKSRNESGNNNTSLTKIKSRRTRAQRALSQPIFSQASLAIIEKARVESDMKENISEEIITGKTSLTDRVAFWTRRSSFLTEKKDDENKAAKTEEIVGVFRRQGSVRDMASKFGKFERNSQTRKSWCAPSASLKLQQQQALQQEEQEQPSPKIRSRTVGSKMSVSSNEENQKPVPKVRKHSIDARAEETKPAAVPVPKMRSSLIPDQQQKVRIRKKKTDNSAHVDSTLLPEKMTPPDVEKRAKTEIKSSIADRRSMIELNSQNWKAKTIVTNSSTAEKKKLADRIQSLSNAQQWKNKTPVADHKVLAVSRKAERYASPSRVAVSSPVTAKKATKKAAKQERDDRTKFIPMVIVSDATEERDTKETPISMVEQIATRKGERQVNIVSERTRKVPKQDVEGLESLFTTDSSKNRHSIAIGELDSLNFDDLPTQSANLMTERMSRPRKKKNRPSVKNPLKSGLVEDTGVYTEQRTNLGLVMSGRKYANSALAGLAAKEDLKQVRLRSASRSRVTENDNHPWRHPMLIRFKGRRHVRPRLVPCTVSSVNHMDSFILITGSTLYTFIPELSNVAEKAKVNDFAKFVCQTKDLGTSAQQPKAADSKFWSLLGGKLAPLEALPIDPDEDDEAYEANETQADRVWHLTKDDKTKADSLQPLIAQWGRPPEQKMLKSDGVYVFEFGDEVYYWMGAQVPFPTRRAAVKLIKRLWEGCERSDSAFYGKVTQHRETALFTEKFADWKRPNQDQLLTPIQHREQTDTKLPVKLRVLQCDLDKENQQAEIKSGLYNIVNGDGDFVDERDGRILTITTDSYELKTSGPNGTLVEFKGDKLSAADVILLIWSYRISGTGKWAGRNMRENKKRPPPAGDSKKLVMLWGGQRATEVALGEAALLATQLRLGPLHRVECGAEPDCFTKAWRGRLMINTCSEDKLKMYLCLGTSEEAFYLQQVEHDPSNLRGDLSALVIHPDSSVAIKPGNEPQYYEHYKKQYTKEVPFSMSSSRKAVSSDKIAKMFKIERVVDQLVPVQLKTINRPGNHKFVQSQLKGIALVLTDTMLFLWHEENEEEGSNKTEWTKMIQHAHDLGQQTIKALDKEVEFKTLSAGTESLEFRKLFPTWESTILHV